MGIALPRSFIDYYISPSPPTRTRLNFERTPQRISAMTVALKKDPSPIPLPWSARIKSISPSRTTHNTHNTHTIHQTEQRKLNEITNKNSTSKAFDEVPERKDSDGCGGAVCCIRPGATPCSSPTRYRY